MASTLLDSGEDEQQEGRQLGGQMSFLEHLDELRRRKRRANLETEPEDTSARSLEDHAELALRREVVRAAMTTLDGKERDLIALKFSGGLSNAEIARVLGMSETNAGTRLHRALTKLRKACDDQS